MEATQSHELGCIEKGCGVFNQENSSLRDLASHLAGPETLYLWKWDQISLVWPPGIEPPEQGKEIYKDIGFYSTYEKFSPRIINVSPGPSKFSVAVC